MLTITVGATDVYDEEAGTFGLQGGFELRLEHSLVSLSKWESMHEKPFLGQENSKSPEELLSYIECMVLTESPPEDFLHRLSEKNVEEIQTYINRKMTATWFSEHASSAPQTQRNQVITAELIYYWMTVFHIPMEWETRHLNRLFTLIRVCNEKQATPKKMSKSEIARRNRELNERRKRELGTKG